MKNGNGNGNQTPPMDNRDKAAETRDKQLMKAAKNRVEARCFLKWMFCLGAVIWILHFILWQFTEDRGDPGGFMIVWGMAAVILHIIVVPSLMTTGKADKKKNIMTEYEKLKSRDINS